MNWRKLSHITTPTLKEAGKCGLVICPEKPKTWIWVESYWTTNISLDKGKSTETEHQTISHWLPQKKFFFVVVLFFKILFIYL